MYLRQAGNTVKDVAAADVQGYTTLPAQDYGGSDYDCTAAGTIKPGYCQLLGDPQVSISPEHV